MIPIVITKISDTYSKINPGMATPVTASVASGKDYIGILVGSEIKVLGTSKKDVKNKIIQHILNMYGDDSEVDFISKKDIEKFINVKDILE